MRQFTEQHRNESGALQPLFYSPTCRYKKPFNPIPLLTALSLGGKSTNKCIQTDNLTLLPLSSQKDKNRVSENTTKTSWDMSSASRLWQVRRTPPLTFQNTQLHKRNIEHNPPHNIFNLFKTEQDILQTSKRDKSERKQTTIKTFRNADRNSGRRWLGLSPNQFRVQSSRPCCVQPSSPGNKTTGPAGSYYTFMTSQQICGGSQDLISLL